MSQKEAQEMPEIMTRAQKRSYERDSQLQPTINIFRTVLFETNANLPFLSHETLFQLQVLNGLDLGYHFYGWFYCVQFFKVL